MAKGESGVIKAAVITTVGGIITALVMVLAPLPMSEPSDTSGIFTPKPMNDRPVSVMTAATTPRVKLITSNEPMFGSRWRMTMRMPRTPM